MENNTMNVLIWALALVVYLTQLPPKRLRDFGDFLKKVLGVLPITQAIDAIMRNKKKDEDT